MLHMASTFEVIYVIISNAKKEKWWGKRQSVFTYLRNVPDMGQSPGDSHYKTNCCVFKIIIIIVILLFFSPFFKNGISTFGFTLLLLYDILLLLCPSYIYLISTRCGY